MRIPFLHSAWRWTLALLTIQGLGGITTLAQSPASQIVNDFGLRFFQVSKPDSANFFVSPLSLHIALAAVGEGARNKTKTESDNVLFGQILSSKIRAQYEQLILRTTNLTFTDDFALMKGEEPVENKLSLATSLWVNTGKKAIRPEYLKETARFLQAEIFEVDSLTIKEKINQWVGEKTNQRLGGEMDIDPNLTLGVINAVYFHGQWESPFDKKKTKEKRFHNLNRSKSNLPFLNEQNRYDYFENDEVQSIRIPYANYQFSMQIILPQQRNRLLELEKKIDLAYIETIKKQKKYHEVILSLPKFRIETDLDPKDKLKALGYQHAFSDSANLSGISETERLKLNRIHHRTMIEINEKNTEAAGYSKVEIVVTGGTGVSLEPPPPPKIFNANHPFMFLIEDNRTGAILFIGRFVGN